MREQRGENQEQRRDEGTNEEAMKEQQRSGLVWSDLEGRKEFDTS